MYSPITKDQGIPQVDENTILEEIKDERPEPIVEEIYIERPDAVKSITYKLKSGFTKFSIFVTIGYININNKIRPYEIFINSKDLSKAAEYTAITRLVSAIFRRSVDPTFILEELISIYDPNGGYLKDGKYVSSFYAEIGNIIERFFVDFGILEKKEEKNVPTVVIGVKKEEENILNDNLRICPYCGQKTLVIENGCATCINPDCTYSHCDT